MSRSANALTALAFGYLRYGLAIASGFIILPLALHSVDGPTYRKWLVTAEVLSYLGFVELGIATLLPWVVAERDGCKDRQALRQLIADARACCALSLMGFAVAFGALWIVVPGWIALDEGISSPLGASVLVYAACIGISFYGRLHLAVLEGLQDVLFLGGLMVVQYIAGIAATIGLLLMSAGPIALAIGLGLPLVIVSAGGTWRVARRDLGLVIGLPRPSWRGMLRLTAEASGTWVGGVGTRLILSSNALLITLCRGTDTDVIRFVCTTKLADLLMMQSWQVIDSGLVGLAQLHGEGRKDRVREIVSAMIRLALIGAGASAIVILGFNPAFVTLWLGADRFAGFALNGSIALTLFGLSLAHVLSVTLATVGYRIRTGFVNLMHGLIYALAALCMGYFAGPLGVSVSGALAALLVATPVLWKLNRLAISHPDWELLRLIFCCWMPRAALPVVIAATVGTLPAGRFWAVCAPSVALLVMIYLVLMRPLLCDLPLPKRLESWTRRLRLLPGTAS